MWNIFIKSLSDMPKLISRFNPKGSWWVKFLDAWLKGDKVIVIDELTEIKRE